MSPTEEDAALLEGREPEGEPSQDRKLLVTDELIADELYESVSQLMSCTVRC